MASSGAEPFIPDTGDLDALRAAAAACTGCGLHAAATQTVFGDGPGSARFLLLGEQPGDAEDRRGQPFVGPAGSLLDRALADAGIARDSVFLTNVVKHFKFVPAERGKRRIHKKPAQSEINACLPWLRAELAAVRPEVVVCLGATAAKALLGSSFRVSRDRGTLLDLPDSLGGSGDERVLTTIHPSAVLRAGEERDAAYAGLVADLRTIAH